MNKTTLLGWNARSVVGMRVKSGLCVESDRVAIAWRECGWKCSGSEIRAREWVQLGVRMCEFKRGLGFEVRVWRLERKGLVNLRVGKTTAPGERELRVSEWASSKTHLKRSSSADAVVPPGGRSRAARRRISEMPLHQFFWCGARRELLGRQAASSWNAPWG